MKNLSRIAVLALVAVAFLAVAPPRAHQSSSQNQAEDKKSHSSSGEAEGKNEPPVPPYYKSAKEALLG